MMGYDYFLKLLYKPLAKLIQHSIQHSRCWRKKGFSSALVLMLLAACHSGEQSELAAPNLAAPSSLAWRHNNQAAKFRIESVDLYSLNFDIQKPPATKYSLQTCSRNNTFCVSASNVPAAGFAAGLDGMNYWVMPDYPFLIHVVFKQDVDASFRLSQLYNDLLKSQQISGRVVQIDSHECDGLAKRAGTECDFYFIYTGETYSQVLNAIHFVFKSSTESLDYVLNASNVYLTNNEVPVLNDNSNSGLIWLANSVDELDDNLIHSLNFQAALINFGYGEISGKDDQATIMFRTSSNFGLDPLQLFVSSATYTSCGNRTVSGGGGEGSFCQYGFYYYPNSNHLASGISRLVFSYDNGQQTINYSKRLVLSLGDFQPFYESSLRLTSGLNKFNILKSTLNNNGLAYSFPVRNFSLSLKYQPNFFIGSQESKDRLFYAYGDILAGLKPVSFAQIIANIILDYDVACFEKGFDPAYDLDPIQSLDGRKCPVSVRLKEAVGYTLALNYAVYANYVSLVDDYPISQYLGNLTINN